jgi:hypothetical protein
MMYFKIVSEIYDIEVIAANNSIREIAKLKSDYGDGRWRKLKGVAMIELIDGSIRQAEIHWYEAHGIGKRKLKIKAFLD